MHYSVKILCKECKKKIRRANAEYMKKYRAKIKVKNQLSEKGETK